MEEKRQHDRADAIDRILDASLAQYTAAEPRAGLEERILANLQSAQAKPERMWWQWSVAALAVIIIVAGLVIGWRSSHASRPVTASHAAARAPATSSSGTHDSHPATTNTAHRGKTPAHKRSTAHAVEVVAENPKLDQFPSPQPMNEQEQLLMSYVSDSPDQAVLVARARTEALERDREEQMRELAAENNELQPQ